MGLDNLQWCSASGGDVPKDAIRAGLDAGSKVYVARAHHEGAIIPGKLHKTHTSVYIPYNMKEVPVENYEVLCGPPACLSWVEGSGSDIPVNAVQGGQEADGETLYIGRVIHEGTVTVGKVHPSHGTCYVAYGGDELGFADYEILVKNKLGQILNV
ncbi:Natterin-4 [Orchesella cincta]|uniref:Natterin-4 n=1 Tax=Orchesella cincta TaxID=48709 RepID=A0A1D2MM28_ORCCI|nr:Natterin-4 [Orchesella cincta]